MDGTLIDSEPYWHDSELTIAREHGGYWDKKLAWEGSGTPIPVVASRMIELGCKLDANEIGRRMIDYVYKAEIKRIPWIDGVQQTLEQLRDANVPNVLVTTSTRDMAENLIKQAPQGAFVTYVCGDDDVEKKPSPAPYLLAAHKLGVAENQMAQCVAIEDSMSGLTSASKSGATTIAQTATMQLDTSQGPQFASINGYSDVTPELLEQFVQQRLRTL
nr:HAD family phosphatase [Bifidobacterium dolichotidis]